MFTHVVVVFVPRMLMRRLLVAPTTYSVLSQKIDQWLAMMNHH
jgi:hypothetical protein